jgi:hypothetical protein
VASTLSALALVRVPTEQQEQCRAIHRQREQLVKVRKVLEAQDRSLMVTRNRSFDKACLERVKSNVENAPPFYRTAAACGVDIRLRFAMVKFPIRPMDAVAASTRTGRSNCPRQSSRASAALFSASHPVRRPD